MMWVRLDCTVSSHRKLLRAGAEAAWLWVCGLAHANKHTTNGVIVRDDLVALYPVDGWTPARRRALVAKLVEVGLWEVIDADSWSIHGYAEHQSEAMTEAVEARREYERAKKRSQRDRWKTSVSGGVSRGDTQGDTDGTPIGTPIGTPQGNPVGIPPGVPDSDRPTVRPSDRPEERETVAAPPAPPTPPLALTSPADEEKPAKAKRPKADKPPPPFSVADALGAIASTAGRRFVPGDATTWTGGWKIAIAQHVRRFPDLSTWSLVGEWLAHGGASWAPTHGAQWAASNHLVDAVAKAQAWAANGRGVVDAKAAVAAPPVAPAAVPAFVPAKGPVMITDPAVLARIRERNRRAREEDGL